MKARRVMCPERDDLMFRAENASNSEILESTDLAALFRRIAADPEAGWTLTATLLDEQDDNPPALTSTPMRVVLNRNTAWGATSGDVFGKEAAFELARNYWAQAEDGHRVQIFFPPDSRDRADWQWVKGKDSGP